MMTSMSKSLYQVFGHALINALYFPGDLDTCKGLAGLKGKLKLKNEVYNYC